MAEQMDGRVAVYIDFDNIVISRYDQLNGNGAWRRHNARDVVPSKNAGADEVAAKLAAAEIDVGAIIDYASSFGTVALSRAYADWSVPVNASYRKQLVNRAVDLTQLFPTTKAFKNGADIRLSVDVLEDLFQLPDLTHVVIVAGDSDYIALAQACKRLGKFVLGIGVSGRTSPALIAACDHFEMYDVIPGTGKASHATAPSRSRGPGAIDDEDEPDEEQTPALIPVHTPSTTPLFVAPVEESDDPAPMTDRAATRLLVRALELLQSKDDEEWRNAASVKTQIRRLDPSFNERTLGSKTFTDFLKSRNRQVEVKTEGNERLVRLR